MKKNILVASVLTALSAGAQAQSSVTLYGIVDEGVMFNSNTKLVKNGVNVGARQFTLDSTNGSQGSRWGLRGSEDLGAGLHAIFTLESGINLSNGAFGQGGTAFGRQAFMGLSSDHLGTLTLGRQYDMVHDFPGNYGFAAAYGGPTTEHPDDLDNLNHGSRVNNSIKYTSPNVAGFTFGALASLGGVAGEVSENSGYSLGAGYSHGPVNLGVAYEFFKNPSNAGAVLSSNASASTFNSVNSGYLSTRPAASLQIVAAGGNYTIGPVVLGATYSNVKYNDIGALHGATATFNSYEVNGQVTITPALSAMGEYNYTKGNAVVGALGNQHYNQFTAMLQYALSKATFLYAIGTYQIASGTNSLGTPAVADIGNLGDSSNNHQAVVRLAVQHRF